MKKIIALLIVGIFVFSGASVAAVSTYDLGWGIESKKVKLSMFDELDQYQPDMEFFAPVGNIFLAPEINYHTAQSFIPTKNVLTRVEILAGKNSTASYDFTLAIRDDLLGPDLTSLSLPPSAFVTENFSWVEFDFDDIGVTPGTTYYIVCTTFDYPDNWYAWGAELTDVYPYGSVWWSEDDGASFEEDPDADLTFPTYGYDNEAPSVPDIDGPVMGKPNQEITITFVSTDPEADDIKYHVDWGEGTTDVTSFYPSGADGSASFTYPIAGTYVIKVKAEDEFGADSDWGEFTIEIEKSRTKNIPFYRLLQNHCKIFQRIVNLFRL